MTEFDEHPEIDEPDDERRFRTRREGDRTRVVVERNAMRIIVILLSAVVLSVGTGGYVVGARRVRADEIPLRLDRAVARLDSVVLAVAQLTTHAAETDRRLGVAEAAIQDLKVNGSVTAQATYRLVVCHMTLKNLSLATCRRLQIPLPGDFLQETGDSIP
jgi:uncharacterized membrane protein